MEIRSFMENATPKVVENRTIEGYAVVFNQESEVMFDWEHRRFFKEIILPSAITADLIKRSDVKAVVEHDRKRMLARSYKGKGTLTLEVDEVGVKYRFEAPNTTDGDYVVEMIMRGDMFGSSFCYTADEKEGVSYRKLPSGTLLREVSKINGFYDVSPVSDPAYMKTNVSVRNLEKHLGLSEEDEKSDDEEPTLSEEAKKEIDNIRKESK